MIRIGVVSLLLLLTACLPAVAGQTVDTPPAIFTADLNQTAAAMAQTLLAQTSVPLSTPSLVASSTFTPIASPTAGGEITISATVTVTSTLASSTLSTAGTPATSPAGLDQLPPGTDYGTLHLENRSNRRLDITLYCTTPQGYQTVLDYSNVYSLNVRAPLGNYSFVAYVGGVKFTGSFSMLTSQKLTLTIYRDRVAIH